MPVNEPRYTKEEFARRGDAIYERYIRSQYEATHKGQFVAIDIATGAFAIDAEERVASERLRAVHPQAEIWMRRIGRRYLRRLGSRGKRRH